MNVRARLVLTMLLLIHLVIYFLNLYIRLVPAYHSTSSKIALTLTSNTPILVSTHVEELILIFDTSIHIF